MIVGIGSDLCNIERIQKSLDRWGDKFLNRVFTEIERAKAASRPHTTRRHPRQALRRQGGLLQGGRHRLQARRLHEGHRRR